MSRTKQGDRRFQKVTQARNITQSRKLQWPIRITPDSRSVDDIRGITIRERVYRTRSFDIDRDTHHPGSRPIIRIDPASIARHTRTGLFLWIWSIG